MNKGTIVLLGSVLGAGALVYQGTTGGSAARPTATATPAVQETVEIAHSGKTVKPAASPSPAITPLLTSIPKLTLDQIRALPRPGSPSNGTTGNGPSHLPSEPAGPAGPSATPADATAHARRSANRGSLDCDTCGEHANAGAHRDANRESLEIADATDVAPVPGWGAGAQAAD